VAFSRPDFCCEYFTKECFMKKLLITAASVALLSGSAFAADLPSRKAPVLPPPPPPPMWTGFYAGLNAGGAWGNNAALNAQTWNVAPSGFGTVGGVSAALLSGSANTSGNAGFIGGGQIGYNWQIGGLGLGSGIVTGIEADIQGIASSGGNRTRTAFGSAPDIAVFPGPTTAPINTAITSYQTGSSSLQYLGTVRGRLGILAMPTLLIYGTGGLAYGGVSASIQNVQFGNTTLNSNGTSLNTYTAAGTGNFANTMVGWTAGGGAEWMFLPNWSAKVEYLYYDLGRATGSVVNTFGITSGDGAGTAGVMSITNYTGRVSGNIVRAGVNYHFNWGAAPVVAKY
jgi:outer membrane immunogenic protein